MAKVTDCPGFETFGADVKAARKAKHMSRKAMAEMINIDWRYLANIENEGTIPSLPIIIQLIKICGIPVEQYFNQNALLGESAQRQRISQKLKLCPEQYLPIIEGAIDGALQMEVFCGGYRLYSGMVWVATASRNAPSCSTNSMVGQKVCSSRSTWMRE